MDLYIGWLEGGGARVLAIPAAAATIKGTAIIQNAFNMEERCHAIEQLGGSFYENPKSCRWLDLP